ncbi:MAG: 3-phosphoshikimate 1-carboxyvinyltransferase [Thermodesulfobacteriota bacterium]
MDIESGASLRGECTVPGDKSISHRAVMLASIAEGKTTVNGFLEGEDNLSTIRAFESLGIGIERNALLNTLTIEGKGLYGLREPRNIIDAGNSGTTARLISGILSAIPFFSVITGDASLRQRPMGRIIEPLRLMGANISGRGDGTLLPLAINGTPLTGIEYSSPIASAQVKSAVLLAGLYARGTTVVTEPYKSRDHTERMLELFGAKVIVEGNTVSVKGGARLESTQIDVPGDISSAAFLMVGALITEGSEIIIKKVGINPTRCGIINILKKMGADIEITNSNDALEPTADLTVKSSALHGVEVSGSELLSAIDEFPALCVAAASAKGKTIISGAKELRVKESDRIHSMATLLKALGVDAEERDDGIEIEGSPEGLKGGSIKSFNDHRIAMAAAVASLKSEGPVEIDDISSVDVSFPGFFDLLDGLSA